MNCERCSELCAVRTQIVAPSCPPGGLLAIGEAPGAEEDRLGFGFAGQAGKTLDALLASHGVPRAAYGQANICRCRPPGNRRPVRAEVDNCVPLLAEFLLERRPRILLLVGGTAAAYFLGPGPLFQHLERSAQAGGVRIDQAVCHAALRGVAETLSARVIPMPHTSGMAWHRKAPNGESWKDLGRRQVELAVRLLKSEAGGWG